MPTSDKPAPASSKSSPIIEVPKGALWRGKYGKGWLRDKPEVIAKLPSTKALFGARKGAPTEYSLEQYVTTIYDQLQTSSCTGWAYARGVHVRLAAMGTPIVFPSAQAIYKFGRMIDRPSAATPLADTGANIGMVTRGIAEWGVPSSAQWPFDPTTINTEPPIDEVEDASVCEIQGTYVIGTDGAERLADVQQAISSNYPVCIGVDVDEGFEDYEGGVNSDGSPIAVKAPNPNALLGGHMLCIIGYKVIGGATYYRGVNSWSEAWGDNGLFWADSTFLTNNLTGNFQVITAAALHSGLAR